MKPYFAISGFLVLLALSACQTSSPHYLYVPPMDKAGEACVSECDEARFSCVNVQNSKYDACVTDRQFENRVFRDCSQALDVSGTRGACRTPRPCPPPALGPCVEAYNACYTACGGSVVTE